MHETPALFQPILDAVLFAQGTIEEHGWTSHHHRHYFVTYTDPQIDGKLFRKMTDPNKVDLDDASTLAGLQRSVWFWYTLNTTLASFRSNLKIWTPEVIQQNVLGYPTPEIPSVTTIFNELGPICPTLPPLDETSSEFDQLCTAMADCHHSLQQITPTLIARQGTQNLFPPSLPHECLGWKNKLFVELLTWLPIAHGVWRKKLAEIQQQAVERISRNPEQYTLDPDAFEWKNFYKASRPTVTAEIIDTEFAGWSLRHHGLAKAFIRFWANEQRPDLAKRVLRAYLERYETRGSSDFFDCFSPQLLEMISWGNFYDTFRRGHVSRSHPGHVLRKQLAEIISNNRLEELSC